MEQGNPSQSSNATTSEPVRYATFLLIVKWIIYVVAAFLGGTGLGVWAVVWCVFNIADACLAAVLFGLIFVVALAKTIRRRANAQPMYVPPVDVDDEFEEDELDELDLSDLDDLFPDDEDDDLDDVFADL